MASLGRFGRALLPVESRRPSEARSRPDTSFPYRQVSSAGRTTGFWVSMSSLDKIGTSTRQRRGSLSRKNFYYIYL